MKLLQPMDLAEALEARAAHPDALAVRGGTDVMVALNLRRVRPSGLLDLSRVAELEGWGTDGDSIVLGAGLTHARVVSELGDRLPMVATASESTGSLQIRNRGTLGGNVATASPSADALCALVAAGAQVELASVGGVRRVPLAEFVTGPKQTDLAPDELVRALLVRPAGGPQRYAKVAARNALVMGICSLSLALGPERHQVAVCVAGAAPTPVRAPDAEAFASSTLEWDSGAALEAETARRFAELVVAATDPVDDVRGTKAYRRHAVGVLARRCLTSAWEAHRCA